MMSDVPSDADIIVVSLDILGLGQLGLDAFHISATRVDLEQEVRKKLKIFDTETKAHNINLHLIRDGSLDRLKIRDVLVDPVRIGQILYVLLHFRIMSINRHPIFTSINLLSNAIRFIESCAIVSEHFVPEQYIGLILSVPSLLQRRIIIRMAASLEEPPVDGPYLPPTPSDLDHIVNDCDTLFLFFSVEGKFQFSRPSLNHSLIMPYTRQTLDLGCRRRTGTRSSNGKPDKRHALVYR